jgi:lactoylglutathione lyase
VATATEGSHFGIQVRDLERSLEFYRDELGLEVVDRWLVEGPLVEELLQMPGVSLTIALMRYPRTKQFIEITEYREVDWEPVDTNTANPGTCHIAFYVDDLDEVYERLVTKGYEALSPRPVPIEMGPLGGGKCVYMIDPDGIRIELLQGDNHLDGTPRD